MIAQTDIWLYMDWDNYSIAIADRDADLHFPVYEVRMRDSDNKWITIAEFRYNKDYKCHCLVFVGNRVSLIEDIGSRFIQHIKAFQAMLDQRNSIISVEQGIRCDAKE